MQHQDQQEKFAKFRQTGDKIRPEGAESYPVGVKSGEGPQFSIGVKIAGRVTLSGLITLSDREPM